MLEFGSPDTSWSFAPAIKLLQAPLLDFEVDSNKSRAAPVSAAAAVLNLRSLDTTGPTPSGQLGDFTEVWKLFSAPIDIPSAKQINPRDVVVSRSVDSAELDFANLHKGVKWRDELDGADLEDNVDPIPISVASLRTRKRAARRARAKEREEKLQPSANEDITLESSTDAESGEDLESLRRSPDRRALIASMLGRPRPVDHSPPTSPSPPKVVARTPVKKDWPVSNPFLWAAPDFPSSISSKTTITVQDGLTSLQRKTRLIQKLTQSFPEERRYLQNSGLLEPAFTPLNTSPIGVHVFIDMSNISIGFHDCLKVQRGIPITTRVRRIPMNFHALSIVLERGRPAAKRVLGGSDRTSTIEQAESLGYETNILDRVHKVKTPTPHKKRHHQPNHHGSGYASASASALSHGETSGSETPGLHALQTPQQYKWSEQAVDEILHLKMSHSILDSDKPSTIVLATGDAAEAEYSDGFLRMVERALNKGWMVELVSFKMNTSSLYRRKEFRQKWGSMFRWVVLDDFAEYLVESD